MAAATPSLTLSDAWATYLKNPATVFATAIITGNSTDLFSDAGIAQLNTLRTAGKITTIAISGTGGSISASQIANMYAAVSGNITYVTGAKLVVQDSAASLISNRTAVAKATSVVVSSCAVPLSVSDANNLAGLPSVSLATGIVLTIKATASQLAGMLAPEKALITATKAVVIATGGVADLVATAANTAAVAAATSVQLTGTNDAVSVADAVKVAALKNISLAPLATFKIAGSATAILASTSSAARALATGFVISSGAANAATAAQAATLISLTNFGPTSSLSVYDNAANLIANLGSLIRAKATTASNTTVVITGANSVSVANSDALLDVTTTTKQPASTGVKAATYDVVDNSLSIIGASAATKALASSYTVTGTTSAAQAHTIVGYAGWDAARSKIDLISGDMAALLTLDVGQAAEVSATSYTRAMLTGTSNTAATMANVTFLAGLPNFMRANGATLVTAALALSVATDDSNKAALNKVVTSLTLTAATTVGVSDLIKLKGLPTLANNDLVLADSAATILSADASGSNLLAGFAGKIGKVKISGSNTVTEAQLDALFLDALWDSTTVRYTSPTVGAFTAGATSTSLVLADTATHIVGQFTGGTAATYAQKLATTVNSTAGSVVEATKVYDALHTVTGLTLTNEIIDTRAAMTTGVASTGLINATSIKFSGINDTTYDQLSAIVTAATGASHITNMTLAAGATMVLGVTSTEIKDATKAAAIEADTAIITSINVTGSGNDSFTQAEYNLIKASIGKVNSTTPITVTFDGTTDAAFAGYGDTVMKNVTILDGSLAVAAEDINLSLQTEGFTIILSDNADAVTGSSGADKISTGLGDDTINNFVGADTVDGGVGTDTIVFGASAITTALNAAADSQLVNVEAIDASAITSTLVIDLSKQTTDAGFVITGTARADTITGSSGADTFKGYTQADKYIGGTGVDTITFTSTATADFNDAGDLLVSGIEKIDAANASAGVLLKTINQTEGFTITGSAFNDTIVGGSGADTVVGYVGVDSLDGGGGVDTLVLRSSAITPQASSAFVSGVSGTEKNYRFTGGLTEGQSITILGRTVYSTGIATAQDVATAFASGSTTGTAVVAGTLATGFNFAVGTTSTTDAKVTAADNSVETAEAAFVASAGYYIADNKLANFEVVDSSSSTVAVTLIMSAQTEGLKIQGSAYSDTIYGTAAADNIATGAGNDTIYGFAGADTIDGGVGSDTLILAGTSSEFKPADTQLVNVEAIITTAAGAINLSSQLEAIAVTGSSGADSIIGSKAGSSLSGGAGADTITGGAGADTITGGAGADALRGGGGANVYVYTTLTDSLVSNPTAVTESNDLTLGNMVAGQKLIVDGFTVIAVGDATAADVAGALVSGTTVTGKLIVSGTQTSGWTHAAGDTGHVTFADTTSPGTNVTDLASLAVGHVADIPDTTATATTTGNTTSTTSKVTYTLTGKSLAVGQSLSLCGVKIVATAALTDVQATAALVAAINTGTATNVVVSGTKGVPVGWTTPVFAQTGSTAVLTMTNASGNFDAAVYTVAIAGNSGVVDPTGISMSTTQGSAVSVRMDSISDLTATDKIDVSAAVKSAVDAGSFIKKADVAFSGTVESTLAGYLGTADSATSKLFAANAAAIITITGTGAGSNAGTYLVINDGVAGFQGANDGVVKVTAAAQNFTATNFI